MNKHCSTIPHHRQNLTLKIIFIDGRSIAKDNSQTILSLIPHLVIHCLWIVANSSFSDSLSIAIDNHI
jgi:hypothetical protein